MGRSWLELFPEPWRNNPEVVVVMAPLKAKAVIRELIDGSATFGMLEVGARQFGLQVLDPKVASYRETEEFFERGHTPMLPVAYTGPLDDLPQRLLVNDDRTPLCFMTEAMWRPYLHIRQVALANTVGGGEAN